MASNDCTNPEVLEVLERAASGSRAELAIGVLFALVSKDADILYLSEQFDDDDAAASAEDTQVTARCADLLGRIAGVDSEDLIRGMRLLLLDDRKAKREARKTITRAQARRQ
jgi:hypothetical protein